MKVTEDLIQLASFAHFLDEAATTLRGKYTNVKDPMTQLSKKLQVVACNLRPAVNESLRPYVIPDDVPVDLRHKKRKKRGRVATYVILEKLEEILRLLPGSYDRKDLNVCKKN